MYSSARLAKPVPSRLGAFGYPGFAAICFVLFFWAHSGFNTIGILAMLLFALGVLLVLLEVFVLPGFGVPGVTGILLMLGSIGIVAYGHWPHSSSEWIDPSDPTFSVSMPCCM